MVGKIVGHINLPGIFSAAAEDLTASLSRGRVLHQTGNIRDAGAPLEATFRALLAELLPVEFQVRHGYLYDTASACTPQIDLIIAAATRAQIMFKAPDGASYLAATDAFALGEIKTSAKGLKGHLSQFAEQLIAADRMRRNVFTNTGMRPADLISLVVVGQSEGFKEKDVGHHWATHPNGRPDYVVFLDTGRILMSWNTGMAELGLETPATPGAQPSGNDVSIWEPEGAADDRPGIALLWIYYTLMHRLRLSQAHELESALRELVQSEDYSQDQSRRAAEKLAYATDPFSKAMTGDFKLKQVKTIRCAVVPPRKKRKGEAAS